LISEVLHITSPTQVTRERRQLPLKLMIEHKCEIAIREQERVNQQSGEHRKASETLADTLRTVLEETDTRISELKKDAYEFKRDIVVGAESMRTGKTVAEKTTRYMEEKLQKRDGVIEKLRLKNSTIMTHLYKVELQMKQKEQTGDALHYIDFHQLQIENKQYQARIGDRNEQLLRLKMTTSKTVQTLNRLKKALSTLSTESGWLKLEIIARAKQLCKVSDEKNTVNLDVASERNSKNSHGEQVEASGLPSTLDYVSQKAHMYDLQATLCDWGRKTEILDMAAFRSQNVARELACEKPP